MSVSDLLNATLDAVSSSVVEEANKTTMLSLEELNVMVQTIKANTDSFWLIVHGILVFFMQAGFAFLESGCVKTKNTLNILTKHLVDVIIGGLAYWILGWAVAFGPYGNGFIGGWNFASFELEDNKYPSWFFQFVFAATSATIVSGAIAERCQFLAYFIYSAPITGWVYPVVSHWAWDTATPGWLNGMGFQDYAGSGVVHLVGASCALVACIIIGPRRGKFDEHGQPRDLSGHSAPLTALGGFILLFGFLAFNGGSQLTITNPGDADAAARAIISTILGSCGAGLATLAITRLFLGHNWSFSMALNGCLTGMVSMCAGCNTYTPWAAVVVGIFGGCAFVAVHVIMLKLRLDDPLDAVAVHGGGGLTGLICAPIFAYGKGILWMGHMSAPWIILGVNILGAVVIIAWSAVWCFVIFLPLSYFNLYRVNEETEITGGDMVNHGESAYPAAAWREVQYSRVPGDEEDTPAVMSIEISPKVSKGGFKGVFGKGTHAPDAGKSNNGFVM